MSSFDIRNYWPNPATNQQQITQFCIKDPVERFVLTQRFRTVVVGGLTKLYLDDYADGLYKDSWCFYRDPTRGMIEVEDIIPPLKAIYVTGKEIIWGAVQNVGDELSNQLQIDVSKSTGYNSSQPNVWGWNTMTFEALLDTYTNDGGNTYQNVVQVLNVQSFCKTAGCTQSDIYTNRYWLAPGLGIVQVDWISSGNKIAYAKEIVTTGLMGAGAPAS